jgi:hypothetical protein
MGTTPVERAYTGNRDQAAADVIDADLVATAVHALIATSGQWTGTATGLLAALAEKVGEKAKAKTWPTSPRALSGRLRRAAANLRRIGIDVTFDRGDGRKRERIITINTLESWGRHRPKRPNRPKPRRTPRLLTT